MKVEVHKVNNDIDNESQKNVVESYNNNEKNEKTDSLRSKLQKKYNIVINAMKKNMDEIIIGATVFVCGIGLVAGISGINKMSEISENCSNAQLITDDSEYNLEDVYVVYNNTDTHFCTRKNLQKITEDTKVKGGLFETNEYYYRDEIYGYYDIKTGDKVCQDHEDGFYIENLKDFYSTGDLYVMDYKVNLNDVEKEINNDYLLSREPKLKRK